MVLDQTNTWIMRETIQPRLLFRNLRIILEHFESQTPGNTTVELANLLACSHLDRLDIEICTPETLAKDPEGRNRRPLNEVMTLEVVIRQLREKFGMAVKVLIGGPFNTPGKEDITWMWDRPSEDFARVVTSGRGMGRQLIRD